MTEHEPEDKPGIEFDYQLGDDGLQTAVVIRDPNKLRKLVLCQFQWIPSVMAKNGMEYPGFEALEAMTEGEETVQLPVLIVGHMPSHMPPEEAVNDIQHVLLLVDDPSQITTVIGTALGMFTDDKETVQKIMHFLYHLMGGEHDEENEDD